MNFDYELLKSIVSKVNISYSDLEKLLNMDKVYVISARSYDHFRSNITVPNMWVGVVNSCNCIYHIFY